LRAGVDVGGHEAAALHFEAGMAADLDVLADLGDERDAVGLEIHAGLRGDLAGEFIARRP
jgi:hypothetical protein